MLKLSIVAPVLVCTLLLLAIQGLPLSPKSALPAKHLLRGEILDADTRLPLEKVLVSLPELNLEQITSRQGQFRFEVLVPTGAPVKMRATLEGYKQINEDPPAGNFLNTYLMSRDRATLPGPQGSAPAAPPGP